MMMCSSSPLSASPAPRSEPGPWPVPAGKLQIPCSGAPPRPPCPISGSTAVPGPACSQRGFTLIEVLIAAFLLSVGLLGLAGLQVHSLQNSQSASNSLNATFLAADALDMIRANKDQAMSYAIGFGEDPPAGNTTAGIDLGIWKTNINNTLAGVDGDPGLGGRIQVSPGAVGTGNDFLVVITMRWVSARWETQDSPEGRIREFIVRTEL